MVGIVYKDTLELLPDESHAFLDGYVSIGQQKEKKNNLAREMRSDLTKLFDTAPCCSLFF